MGNLIESLIQTDTAVKSTTTSVVTDKDSTKSEPSLFDSLLKQNTPTTTTETTVTKPKEEAQTLVSQIVEDNNVNVDVKENTQKVVDNKTQSSLLDKLVIEVKKDIKNSDLVNSVQNSDVNVQDLVNVDVKEEAQTLVSQIVEDNNVNVDVKEEAQTLVSQIVENNNVNVDVKENTQKVVDNKTQSSLLDKLVIEVKKDIKSSDLVNNVQNSDVNVENSDANEFKTNDQTILSSNGISSTENTILPVDVATSEKRSLMDLLIERNTKISTINDQAKLQNDDSSELVSNIYLSSQKNAVNTQLLSNKNEAMNLLKEATSVKDIEKSANLLDLGLENVSLEQINETVSLDKNQLNKIVDRTNILDKLFVQKNIKDNDIKDLIIKSDDATTALISDKLNYNKDSVVNVNSPLSFNIQSKIIGAKQQMSNMMSEIARQMYENYKPPVTAFKINLNPMDLGSIAILMKTDKSSALSISMSVSNQSTLDTLIENQNMLKSSLSKSFDEGTKLNLDFSSSNQNNSNSQSFSNNQSFNSQREQQPDTQTILQLKEENRETEEKPLDYM